MDNKKEKETLIAIAVIAAVLAVLAGLYIFIADRYASQHYTAVIFVQGERNGETYDSFEGQSECQRGGHITAGDVVLEVVKIDWKGSVTFRPIQGAIKDVKDNAVDRDTLAKGERKYYKSTESSFSVSVRNIKKD